MSQYVVGDVHGCWTALRTLSEFVPFQPEDTIITLGDYIDRGPDSRDVVEWVMERHAAGTGIPLRGNHEVMLLQAMQDRLSMAAWLQFGGREMLDSYAPQGKRGRSEDIPIEHLRFLDQSLLPYYETETHLFVHATLLPDLELADQPAESLYWNRFNTQKPHQSGKLVICGHTAQKSGLPADLGYALCLDTWVYGRGWLTCMNLETETFWQANQQGATRTWQRGETPPSA